MVAPLQIFFEDSVAFGVQGKNKAVVGLLLWLPE